MVTAQEKVGLVTQIASGGTRLQGCALSSRGSSGAGPPIAPGGAGVQVHVLSSWRALALPPCVFHMSPPGGAPYPHGPGTAQARHFCSLCSGEPHPTPTRAGAQHRSQWRGAGGGAFQVCVQGPARGAAHPDQQGAPGLSQRIHSSTFLTPVLEGSQRPDRAEDLQNHLQTPIRPADWEKGQIQPNQPRHTQSGFPRGSRHVTRRGKDPPRGRVF